MLKGVKHAHDSVSAEKCKRAHLRLVFLLGQVSMLCVCLSACTGTVSDQPTPTAAKWFMKLGGYDFDEK